MAKIIEQCPRTQLMRGLVDAKSKPGLRPTRSLVQVYNLRVNQAYMHLNHERTIGEKGKGTAVYKCERPGRREV